MRLNISKDETFVAPSGQTYRYEDLFLIREMAKNRSIAWSQDEVTFNSGFKSHVYVRMRNDLTHNAALLHRVGVQLKNFVLGLKNTHGPNKCLIGIPAAGTPLAQAAAREAYDPYHDLEARICSRQLRSMLKKGHGKGEDNMWAGPPELERYSPITIENVISTAKAYFDHLEHLNEDGYPTKEMHHVAFADWELGGMEALTDAGYQGFARYRVRDMIAALVYLEDWPREHYEEVNRRINVWRIEHNLKQAA
jgi:orotate phosphoribosyltransferase